MAQTKTKKASIRAKRKVPHEEAKRKRDEEEEKKASNISFFEEEHSDYLEHIRRNYTARPHNQARTRQTTLDAISRPAGRRVTGAAEREKETAMRNKRRQKAGQSVGPIVGRN